MFRLSSFPSLDQLDLSDQIHSWLERIVSWLPGCWTYLALMRLRVLRSLHFAKRLLCGAADAVVMHLHRAENARWIDDERAAERETLVWRERQVAAIDEHTKRCGDLARRIRTHRERNLFDSLGRVMPCLVYEDGVRGERHDLSVHFLELRIQAGHFFKLRRADEGEVCRVEHNDEPLGAEVGELHRLRRIVLEGLEFIIRHCLTDAHRRNVLPRGVMEVAAHLTIIALLSVCFHKCNAITR